MGVDIQVYRQRIGVHYSRQGAGRKNAKEAECNAEWKPETVFCSQQDSCRSRRSQLPKYAFKAGLLGGLLYSSLLLACITDLPLVPVNRQDFSHRLLLSGDVELNPGPDMPKDTALLNVSENPIALLPHVKEKLESISTQVLTANAGIESKLCKVVEMMRENFDTLQNEFTCTNNFLKWLSDQQDSIKLSIQESERRCQASLQSLSEWNKCLQSEQDVIREKIDCVCREFPNDLDELERQREQLEMDLRRNNVRLFGVPEVRRESYWDCLHTVLKLLNEAVPDVDWEERDIVRVQRIGAGSKGKPENSPRPILVSFVTWSNKLTVLQRGRDPLRQKGVKISSDLTNRQAATLRDLRRQGHVAYFRNNRLHYRDFNGSGSRRSPALQSTVGSIDNLSDGNCRRENGSPYGNGISTGQKNIAAWNTSQSAVFSRSRYSAARRAPDLQQHVDERMRRNLIQINLNEQSNSSADLPDSEDISKTNSEPVVGPRDPSHTETAPRTLFTNIGTRENEQSVQLSHSQQAARTVCTSTTPGSYEQFTGNVPGASSRATGAVHKKTVQSSLRDWLTSGVTSNNANCRKVRIYETHTVEECEYGEDTFSDARDDIENITPQQANRRDRCHSPVGVSVRRERAAIPLTPEVAGPSKPPGVWRGRLRHNEDVCSQNSTTNVPSPI